MSESEKPKGAATDRPPAAEQGRRRQPPGTLGRRNDADAITPSGEVDPQKLRQNQQRLQVGGDHRTEAMRKGKRGTYP